MNYDGPSFYKRNQSRTALENQEKDSLNSKFDWSAKENLAKSEYAKNISKRSQTRAGLEKEVARSITSPRNHLQERQQSNFEKPKNYYFKRKQIPKSLQKLGGWQKNEWSPALLEELSTRLTKTKDSYLLFLDDEEEQTDEVHVILLEDTKGKSWLNQLEKEDAEKIMRIQKEVKENLRKPQAGLHYSLLNLKIKNQATIENGKK